MNKKKLILVAVLLIIIITVGVFFFFPIPGTRIVGVDDISAENQVIIRQNKRALVGNSSAAGGLESADTITEYNLNAEQIEMLKEFIRGNSYVRTLRSAPSQNTPSTEYNIIISDDISNSNTTSAHIRMSISIISGYVSGLEQSGNGCLKIKNPSWEDSIQQILALLPASR